MVKKRVIILGAGLTGLSAAWHLKQKGVCALVIEKEPQVGGLCRSKKLGGFTFDYCGHLLHFRHPYVFKLVNDLMGKDLIEHRRNAWVYAFKQYIPYPFQANIRYLPKNIRNRCISGLAKAGRSNSPPNANHLNFADWIIDRFGSGIAKYFMIPYNNKFWTTDLKGMNSEWSNSFIPVPKIRRHANGDIFLAKLAGDGYNSRFWYPKEGGIQNLPLSLAQGLKNVIKGSAVDTLDLEKKVVKLSCGAKERFDVLVSTIPLPEMPLLIKRLPEKVKSFFKALKWNSILNLNLGVNALKPNDKHWIYFPEENRVFFRAGFFSNFSLSMAPENKVGLYAEISYSPNKPLQKINYINETIAGLQNLGFLKNDDGISVIDINNIQYAYPIYDFNRESALKGINEFLNEKSVFSVGRYGGWKYLSMEDALLEGRNVAERILTANV
jgi:protoporphyrinogen oxidase